MRDRVEITKIIVRSVPSPFIVLVELTGSSLVVELDDDLDYPDYFQSGDKINKILSIEIARWFVKMPEVNLITATIDLGNEVIGVKVDRSRAEEYFGVPLDDRMKAFSGMGWQRDILNRFDLPAMREEFVERFAIESL